MPATDSSPAREKQTSDTLTAAPSITHGSSLHASKIRRLFVAAPSARRFAPLGWSWSRRARPGGLAGCDLLAGFLEPVTDEVRFRGHAVSVGLEHPRHVVLAQVGDQELATQERRVALDDGGHVHVVEVKRDIAVRRAGTENPPPQGRRASRPAPTPAHTG